MLTWPLLFGQVAVDVSPANPFLSSMPWFAWVAIVAIVMGGLNGLLSSIHRHRERMAMIRQGMHPDAQKAPDLTAKQPFPESAEL